MTSFVLRTRFHIGQEVYYIKNSPRKVLTCSQCNSFRNEYRKVVAKAKIKDITFSGNVRDKSKMQYSYTITNTYMYNVNEKDLFATREEAEAKSEHKKAIC